MTPKDTAPADEKVEQEAVAQVNDALTKLAELSTVDEGTLSSVDNALKGLNGPTRAAVMALPSFQKLVDQAAEAAAPNYKPGDYMKMGEFITQKVPYSMADIFEKWPPVESYIARETIPVIFDGWTFMLHEGVVYDQPRSVKPENLPENHGYQLPSVVIGILNERYETLRKARIETETKEFGQGVRFIQTGWPGKDVVIGEGFGGNQNRDDD